MFESETYEERCWKAEAENARLREDLAAATNKLEMAEAVIAGDGALITGLKNDLAAEIKMRNVWQCAYEESREDLAAAQATIAQMREKSEAAKNACMVASSGCSHIKTHAECNEARQFAHATKINVETILSALNEALALPANLDALHEARAQAVEEAKCFFDPHSEYFGDSIMQCLDGEAADHRARKEGK